MKNSFDADDSVGVLGGEYTEISEDITRYQVVIKAKGARVKAEDVIALDFGRYTDEDPFYYTDSQDRELEIVKLTRTR